MIVYHIFMAGLEDAQAVGDSAQVRWLGRLEKQAGVSAYHVAKHVLGMMPAQYYRLRDGGNRLRMDHLCKILRFAENNGIKSQTVISWIEEEFGE